MSDQVMEIYTRAMAAAEQGRFEDALADFIWLHDHPNDTSESYRMMRCGYVLTSWITVGQTYPPALVALEKILETKRERLNTGDPDTSLVSDVEAIESRLQRISTSYRRHSQ